MTFRAFFAFLVFFLLQAECIHAAITLINRTDKLVVIILPSSIKQTEIVYENLSKKSSAIEDKTYPGAAILLPANSKILFKDLDSIYHAHIRYSDLIDGYVDIPSTAYQAIKYSENNIKTSGFLIKQPISLFFQDNQLVFLSSNGIIVQALSVKGKN